MDASSGGGWWSGGARLIQFWGEGECKAGQRAERRGDAKHRPFEAAADAHLGPELCHLLPQLLGGEAALPAAQFWWVWVMFGDVDRDQHSKLQLKDSAAKFQLTQPLANTTTPTTNHTQQALTLLLLPQLPPLLRDLLLQRL